MQPFIHTCEHNHCLLDIKCLFIQPYICIHEHTHCWMHSPTCIPTPVEKHVANDCWLLVYLEWMSTDDYPLAYDPAGVDTIQSTSSQQLMGVCMGHGNRVSSYTHDYTHYETCIHNSKFLLRMLEWGTQTNTHAHLGGGISQQIFASIQFKTVHTSSVHRTKRSTSTTLEAYCTRESRFFRPSVLEFTSHGLEYQHWLRWIADGSKHWCNTHSLPGKEALILQRKGARMGTLNMNAWVYPHMCGISSEHILCNTHRRVVLSHGKP